MESRLGDIKLSLNGFDIESLEFLTQAAVKILRQELFRAGQVIQATVIKATPVGATGNLRRGWKIDVAGTLENPQIIISNPSEYLLPTELGRKSKFVPIEPLVLWVRRKLGIKPIKKATRVAWAISIWKSKNKTPGQKFVEEAVKVALPRAARQIKQIIEIRLTTILASGTTISA